MTLPVNGPQLINIPHGKKQHMRAKWIRDVFHQISLAARSVHDFAILGWVTHTRGNEPET
jgi:hypothetical protein